MVSLEQIRKLEQKVHAAVSRITILDKENRALRTQVAEYERRLGELQQLVDAFKHDQDEIEAGIVSVLKHLDQLEDRVGDPEEIPTGPSDVSPAEKPHQTHGSHQNAVEAEEPAVEPAPETAPTQPTEAASPDTDDEREDPDEEEPELDIF